MVEKTKDKLVYISMGTVNNDMLSLYQQFIAALAKTDYQVILSVVNQVLKDDSYCKNAAANADGFKRCKGAKVAADKIMEKV